MKSTVKKRLLYVNALPTLSPWTESGLEIPAGVQIEGWPLAKLNEWSLTLESVAVDLILVDVDFIAQNQPLDDWALRAWRHTFNELISRATHPDGHSPVLVAYTRHIEWERAVVALKIGARDIVPMGRLNAPLVSTDEMPTENVIPMPIREKSAAFPPVITAAIPRHAIPFPIEGLEGSSAAIETVRNLIRRTAPLDTSLLIVGPTGSGKERVAQAVHRHSSRADGPFLAVNCGAIAPGLLESELFGHVKGAFTGAVDDRVGLFAAAHGGTFFLDEVSDLPLEFQVKLLRVLQDRQITPVGSSQSVGVDIRLVASTKQDLDERVAQRKFREDLLYRLRVMEITLPALRERKADIPGIAKSILRKFAKIAKRPVLPLSEAAVEKFLLYAWPGNIRELENALDHAVTLAWSESRGTVDVADLPENIQFASMDVPRERELKEAVKNFEREYIQSTVRRLGSKELAADALGLSLATLYRKISG